MFQEPEARNRDLFHWLARIALLRHPGDTGAHSPLPAVERSAATHKRLGPHGIKHATITHALARPDRVQEWADPNDPRTTARYNRLRGALDGSPAYDAASSPAGLLNDEPPQA
ncbi:hypothetical protein GCM10018980_70940 [Streptomyces capoamus]|uniref:Uncharacterized protein n=1 Tax=Streptomyces capoamus TaxID=68183 RepID=A0A919KFW4_9ACTN|nr:hypothetical protein [Streptomyces capoamus]GGW13471.1 hypothetical protein GCM10010501_17170 [Streptomyces libani subsp. rufus]GHG74163.1 hypothetical protein GCM10018980_70940 [Streptomyces capoamus]